MSKQKDILCQLIQDHDGHPSAEELFLICKEKNIKISIATIYRNLNILVQEGKIAKISFSSEPDRYDSRTDSHVHAICDRCHEIEDLNIAGMDEYLKENTHLTIHSYELMIHHTCAKCRKKEALHIQTRL
ncbi:hypothetical protein C815_01728 [Firmicutes bacterium M10-2]|nr:hypothetical protein C815_01728 [Firmicutes bacterium M10-2]